MSSYPVNGHALLSEDAVDLDPDVLEAHAAIAERVLGLTGTALTGADAAEAAGYVALQVNLQLDRQTSGDVVSESKGGQSFTYATVGGKRVAIDPVAYAGVQRLIAVPLAISTELPNTFAW